MWAALDGVRDPELDEAITALGFVAGLDVEGSRVSVRLRLPTYFCAPNFAYLMVADAQAAVQRVDGVTDVDVRLEDHFASDEINAGIAGGRDFASTFPALGDGDLDDLRVTFRRKGLIARQYRLVRRLVHGGKRREQLLHLRIGDLPDTPEVNAYLDRRAELGLDVTSDAPFLVDAGGFPIDPSALELHLGTARGTWVSIDANTVTCRGLLATRYGAHTLSPVPPSPPITPATQPEEPP